MANPEPVEKLESKRPTPFQQYEEISQVITEIIIRDPEKRHASQNLIKKKFIQSNRDSNFVKYEKSWALSVVYSSILKFSKDPSPAQYYSDLIKLNQEGLSGDIYQSFWILFSHLRIKMQFSLLLKYRFLTSVSDIASAVSFSKDSTAFEIEQSIYTLENGLCGDLEYKITQDEIRGIIKSGKFQLNDQVATNEESLIPTFISKNTNWNKTPVVIRNLLEGTIIGVIVLSIVLLIPKITQFYDNQIDTRLELYDFIGTKDADLPIYEPNQVDSNPDAEAESDLDLAMDPEPDEETKKDLDSKTTATRKEAIRVGHYQMWRFELKTESPERLRGEITRILEELVPNSEPQELAGMERPGGIQFNLIVARETVLPLLNRLEKTAKELPKNETRLLTQEPFRWFQSRSRTRLSRGKTQVVIFLSQI